VSWYHDTEVAATKNMTLRLDPALAEQLQAVAAVEGRAVSDLVREAVEALVAARRRDRKFQRRLEASARQQEDVLRRLRDGER
jgi:predicted transcriptional regulator